MSNNPRLIYRTKIATLTPTKTYRVYADHLDTSRRVATNDNEATIVWKWEGKPFGESEATGTLSFNLRFPGQYFDNETETHYNINRDYNPVTGRYIQSDPIGFDGGVNGFGYVNGRPISLIDEEGLVAKINLKRRIRGWRDAENAIRDRESSVGRSLLTTKRTYAMHDDAWYYVYGREYDAISQDSQGRTHFIEVKYRNKYIKVVGRFAKILKVMEANTIRQISFDYEALDGYLNVDLSGGVNKTVYGGTYVIHWFMVYQDGKAYEFDVSSEMMDIVSDIFIW